MGAPAQDTEKPFDGCDYDFIPNLAVMPKQAYLDGTPVDLPGLDASLRAHQELFRELGGGPKTWIVVQVGAGVPEKRVAPFLAVARRAGFVNVQRLTPVAKQRAKR